MNDTAKKTIIYRVHVEHQRVSIEAIPPSRPDYDRASNQAIQRLREAMEIERRLSEKSDFSDETYYFSVLATAKDFAEMIINEMESRLMDDYTAVEEFEG